MGFETKHYMHGGSGEKGPQNYWVFWETKTSILDFLVVVGKNRRGSRPKGGEGGGRRRGIHKKCHGGRSRRFRVGKKQIRRGGLRTCPDKSKGKALPRKIKKNGKATPQKKNTFDRGEGFRWEKGGGPPPSQRT